jgi:anti-sigma-K factor RskA
MNAHEQFVDDLTLYAMGSLEGTEREALEKHLEDCSSCRRELDQIRGDLGLLALTTAGPKPPLRSRQRLVAAIAKEPRMPVAVRARPAPPRRAWWGYAGWAVAAALLLLTIGVRQRNSGLERDLAALRTQVVDQQTRLLKANEVLSTLLDPDAKKIELVAAGARLQPHGKAIYQRRNRSLIFFASDLAQLPPEKIYELWLFPANGGPPIAAGLFKPDVHGSAMVVNPPLPEGVDAKNFAVTLEPESGSHEAPRGTVTIVGVGE